MSAGKRELTGFVVISALVDKNEETGYWRWRVITNMTNALSGGYDTALAAARSMVQELRRHSPEF